MDNFPETGEYAESIDPSVQCTDCDAVCCLYGCIGRCSWPDDVAHGLTRKEALRALGELRARSW